MATKPETTFYTSIHKLLDKKLHREKMNNPYRSGTADCWYSGTADDLWVEYKYATKVPVKAPILIQRELSAQQLLWLEGRYVEGRNVVVILGTPLGAWIYERRSWEHEGVTADQLRLFGRSKKEVADYIWRRTMIT